MILLGMVGPIGHGKSAFSAKLQELGTNARHLESGDLVVRVANEFLRTMPGVVLTGHLDQEILTPWLDVLPDIVTDLLRRRITPELLRYLPEKPHEYDRLKEYVRELKAHPSMHETVIDSENKDQHRLLLQWLANYLMNRVDTHIWFDEIENEIKQAASQGAELITVGGVRFPYDAEVIRRNGGKIVEVLRPDVEIRKGDPTEDNRELIQPEIRILNNGTLDDLSRVAEQFLNDLRAGSPRQEYKAAV